MIGLDTRGRGRKALSAAWMCRMAVVLAAAGAAAGAANAGTLYPLSSYCTRQNTTLSCIIADDKTYQLDSFKWDGIQKAIIKNALVLMLMDPLCSSMAKREVEVHSSSRVTTVSRGNNCSQQVVIYDSKNVRLIDGVDLVRMINSEADEINLPRVSQFDLRESVVKKVSVRVDGEKSTIENSKIEAVKAMVIEGDFQFIVENSTLVKVEGFKYNSTKEATFKDTLLESVATNGFVVERGTVKIQDSRIGSVEALGMAVEGGTLVIANSVLHSVAINSIVVSKGGSVLFENVTVATESGIFFTISKGTMDLYALGLLWHTGTSHSTVSLVLYMGITMVASLGVGAGIMYYKMTRSGVARTEVDMTQLIQREQPNPPCQPDSMAPKPPDSMPPKPPDSTPKPPDSMAPKPPDSRSPKIPNNNNNDKNKNTPAPPLRPLPAPPQPPQDDEMYEQYSDVQLPTGLPPHRPPMPIPDESSSTGGSTLPMSGHHLPMPPNLPKWRDPEGAEMNDDRDRLPPPPPPDDIYDDLMTELPPLKTRTATHAMGLRSPSCLLLLLVLLVPAALLAAERTNTPSLLAVIEPRTCNLDPCPETVDCAECAENSLIADPKNCRGYYICLTSGPSSLPFDCPAGQVFNASAQECQKGDECEECPVVPPTGSCSYECPETDPGLISSFTDCHSYYECDGGKVTGSGTCDASKFFFNGEECQTDERLCCHCHPYCTKCDAAGTFVADPLDCRSYYFCTAPSAVPTVHGTCPDGEHFDYLLQGCSPAAACATRLSCLNVVGADGCIDPFTCVSVGYFARCPNQCTADYYHCTAATGTYQDVESCAVGTVFHPDNHNCVPLANCPY